MMWLTETKVHFGTWMPQTDLETSSVFFFFFLREETRLFYQLEAEST